MEDPVAQPGVHGHVAGGSRTARLYILLAPLKSL
jgi:hypothetical protein